jgi:hypothetical protein
MAPRDEHTEYYTGYKERMRDVIYTGSNASNYAFQGIGGRLFSSRLALSWGTVIASFCAPYGRLETRFFVHERRVPAGPARLSHQASSAGMRVRKLDPCADKRSPSFA